MNPATDSFRGALWLLPALLSPFLALVRHLGSGMRPSERILIAAALAPVALALPALILVLAIRAPFATSFWQSEFLWLVATLWPAGRSLRREHEPRPERGHGFPSVAVATIAFAVMFVTLAPPIASRFLALAGEPWYQTAAAIEIRLHGMPPQDPTFAGMPFYHPWLPPFLLALVRAATGASAFGLQVILAGWAAGVWTLALAHVAYRAFSRAAATAAAAIAVLGLNPIGWLLWLLRPVGGGGALDKLMELSGAEHAAHALGPGFPAGDASLLLRFWGGGEQSLGLALAATLGWNIVRGLERRAGRSWVRTMCLALAIVFWCPATVGPLFVAVLGGWLFASFGAGGRSLGFIGIAALAIGWLIAWPYRMTCAVPGSAGGPWIGWAASHATAFALAVGPLWIAVLPAALLAWQQSSGSRFAVGAMLASIVVALVSRPHPGALDVALPIGWLWIAPLVAGGLVWWVERMRWPLPLRMFATALCILPTTGLLLIGVFGDGRPLGALVRGPEAAARERPLVTEDEQVAYSMIREILPRDAVVIESPRTIVNEPVPVLGERRGFFPPHGVDLVSGYGREPSRNPTLNALREDFQVRQSLQLSLFSEGELSEAQRLYLYTFASPIYMIARHSELPDSRWDGFRVRPEWDEILALPSMRLYRFEGRRP